MAEDLIIAQGANKNEIYETLLPQLEALMTGETDIIANLANVAAALHETFRWWWVGFYLVKENQLVLGPFQGPVACTRIGFGKGVCGAAWKESKTMFVPDVDKFPGHIACSSSSVSEIVVPILDITGQVIGVLDIDSERYDVLDQTDVFYLERVCGLLTAVL